MRSIIALMLVLNSFCHARIDQPCSAKIFSNAHGMQITQCYSESFQENINNQRIDESARISLIVTDTQTTTIDDQLMSIWLADNVKELWMINLGLQEIGRESFRAFQNLQLLDLTNNNISTLDDDAFTGLDLSILNLAGNQIANINAKAFENLIHLERLDLGNNLLKNINGMDLKGKHLTALYINDNNISSLAADTFSNIKHLHDLNLAGNNLEQLPDKIFKKLHHLIWLDISVNKFTKWPAAVNVLNLTRFYCHNNTIDNLNYEFIQNVSIHTSFYGNPFECHELDKFIMDLNRNNVTFERGPTFDGNNIDGIECTKDDIILYNAEKLSAAVEAKADANISIAQEAIKEEIQSQLAALMANFTSNCATREEMQSIAQENMKNLAKLKCGTIEY